MDIMLTNMIQENELNGLALTCCICVCCEKFIFKYFHIGDDKELIL